jgi:hypothetical protein
MGLWGKVKALLSRKESERSWKPDEGAGDDGGNSPAGAGGSPD